MRTDNAHIAPGETYDATAGAAANLSTVWTRRWKADPDALQIHDAEGGWIRRGEIEARSASRAGRLAGLGLSAGKRHRLFVLLQLFLLLLADIL